MCCTLLPFFPHNLHRGLSLVLSMWYFIKFVLISWSCAGHNNASVPTFKSTLANHCPVISLSTFSVVSLMNCQCIRFSLHFSFSSFAFGFLNSTLNIVSPVLIASATDTPIIRFFSELAA